MTSPVRLPVVKQAPTSLPCFPCPHNSSCCSWGVSLAQDEYETMVRLYGESHVEWDAEENEWRTRSDNGRCIFLGDNACTIHDKPEYPRTCRGFPDREGDGTPYRWDKTICPEFEGVPGAEGERA